jgi:3-isopropylmalate/(R)-2-methylmalate dehydratase small subunit
MIQGNAIKFGNNVDTDQIIGAHHLNLPTIRDMAPFTFENDPRFKADFKTGDIIVGGENFGCGSSREQAPAVLKERGVGAIVARSFARIFFRNAINLGIALVECPDAGKISHLERLEMDGDAIRCPDSGGKFHIEPLPPFIREILVDGGIIAHLRRKDRMAAR